MENGASVALGMRLRGPLGFNSFWISVMTLDRYGQRMIPTDKVYSAPEGARYIFRQFLKGAGTHLFLMDDDAVFASGTITRLLSRNVAVVGGLTWTGGLPTMPTLYRGFEGVWEGKHPSWLVRHDDVAKWLMRPEVQQELLAHQTEAGYVTEYNPPDALSRADAVGFHCLLIRRDVLEAIGEPFCEGNAAGIREDFDWSERAARAGFDLCVDKTVFVGHTIVHGIRPLDYFIYQQAIEQNAQDAARLKEQTK